MPAELHDQELEIITRRNDRTVWYRTFEGDGPASLAVTADAVVAAWPSAVAYDREIDVTVAALDLASGDIRWSSQLGAGGPWPDVQRGLGRAMFSPVPEAWADVYGVAPEAPVHGMTDVAILDDRVYVPGVGGELIVLDLADGRQIGTVRQASTPLTSAGRAIIARRDDALVALDPDGSQLWSMPLPEWSPLVRVSGSDTTAYVSISGRYGGGPSPRD